MTSYNREQYIADALRSVLSSSFQDWELIICDDCSTDSTVAIARETAADDPRIRLYVNEENLRQFYNRNKAAGYARGKYIKYLDSDDLFYPDGLKTMVELMEAHPSAGLGYCCPDHMVLHPVPHLYNGEEIYKEHYFINGVLLRGPTVTILKTEAFKAVGGFDFYGMPSDSHFSLKIAARYPVLSMPSGLALWREHDSQAFIGEKDIENIFNNYRWNLDILASAYCPLQQQDQKKAIVNQHKIFIKNLFSIIRSNPAQTGEVIRLIRSYKISWRMLLHLF
jgi:glycosyltransferase involved in cell wall biosynthesis